MYMPMMYNITNKKILIVGGGKIALQKVNVLLDFDCQITLIAPDIHEQIKIQKDKIKVINRTYQTNDLNGADIVICATNDKAANYVIYQEAKAKNLLVNVVDYPDLCDFIFSCYIKKGDLTITINSSGSSPTVCQLMKQEILPLIDQDIDVKLKLLKAIRSKIINSSIEPQRRKHFLQEIASLSIPELRSIIDNHKIT